MGVYAGCDIFICSRFTRGRYVVCWVMVKFCLVVTVGIKVRVSKLLGPG